MARPKVPLEKRISFEEFKKQYADRFLYSHAPTREAKMKEAWKEEDDRLAAAEEEAKKASAPTKSQVTKE